MPVDVDLQAMTDDEISALATRCLDSLSLEEKVKSVLKAFHSEEERAELSEWLGLEEAETEEEEGEEE